MSHIYIERNANGQYEVKQQGNPNPVAVAPTQRAAEEKAQALFPNAKPDVERVRHTQVGHPDQWRKK